MTYDVIIIGGGVIGCALAYECSQFSCKTLVLERSSYVGAGATKANSAMVHEGLNIKNGTLKKRLVMESHLDLVKIIQQLHVPYRSGAGLITLAFTQTDVDACLKQVKDANTDHLHGTYLSREEILQMEPEINPEILGGFYSKSVGIISPYELCIALGECAHQNHVEFQFHKKVEKLVLDSHRHAFVLCADGSEYHSNIILNVAGIHASELAAYTGDAETIRARKGEYLLFDQTYGTMLSHVVSVPSTTKSKGMVILPLLSGNLLAGSSATMTENIDDVSSTKETLDEINRNAIQRILPKLHVPEGVITTFAGNRAVSETEDYVIKKAMDADNVIHAMGIQSPGLSSCIGIARYILHIAKELDETVQWKKQATLVIKPKPLFHQLSVAQKEKLIQAKSAYGEVICRCEQISKQEVLDAIHGELPTESMDAIKRKTRCGMGRCQGGFCLPKLLELLEEETGIPMERLLKDEIGSTFVWKQKGRDTQ